jgi:predicted NBD/HSP70 family sugar kinase
MYLGIDIGGTKTLVACLDDKGVITERSKFPTPQAYDVFLRELAKVIVNLSTKEFIAVGMAVPGKLDREHGTAKAFGNLPWEDIPIKDDIERMVHAPVVIENDANLAGLSEAMLLKNTHDKVLYVTVSTGIGTGIISHQKIDPELADSEGGELLLEYGGRLQHWEDFASGRAIVKRFGKQAREITDEKTWRLIAHDLALGLADLIAVIQPDVIVMGGGVDSYFSRFAPFLQAELKKYETPLVPTPPILQAKRPEEAVVYGCYDLAKSLYPA